MSQASNYLETNLMKALLGYTDGAFGTLSSAPTIHVAITTVPVTDSDTGATITEPTYTSYARVEHNGASKWAEVGGDAGHFDNTGAITFPPVDVGSSAEAITGFCLIDSPTAGTGNIICYGTTSLTIDDNITPQFADADLDIRLS